MGVLVGFFMAWLVGSVLRGGGGSGESPAGDREACSVTLVFLAPVDVIGSAVDLATGSNGVSHVVVDACEVGDDGQALVFDCTLLKGVTRVPAAPYAKREAARIELAAADAWHLRGCLAGRVGQPYGPTCSALVAECMRTYAGPSNPTPIELLRALRAQ